MLKINQTAAAAFAAIPKIELGCWPTPLHTMPGLEKTTGSKVKLFIKRDDLNGVGPGGNKVRTLEYLLAKAKVNGADTLLASGPAQSNLCTLAACCANKVNMRPILVHNAAKPEKLQGNALLNSLCGAEVVYIGAGTDEFQRADAVKKLEDELRAAGKNPYTVLLGGSTGLGAIGYIPVLLEMVEQCNRQNFDIQHIFVPGGNGGVAAGIVYGNATLGSPFKIHVISVEDENPTLLLHMQRIITEMESITGVAMPCTIEKACNMDDSFMGAGWGQNTKESETMVLEFAKAEGIFIENVYTSKVVVAMAAYAKTGKITGGTCFLHTGGFGSLFSQY